MEYIYIACLMTGGELPAQAGGPSREPRTRKTGSEIRDQHTHVTPVHSYGVTPKSKSGGCTRCGKLNHKLNQED